MVRRADLQGDLARYAVIVAAPTAALIATVLVLSDRAGIPPYVLVDDPLSVLDAPPYVGVLSVIGNLVWAAVLAVSAFAAATADADDPELRRLLTGLAVVTAAILVDDAFTLHEQVVLGGSPVKLIIAVIGLWWFVRNRRTIMRRTPVAILVVAVVFGAVSEVVDLATDVARLGGAIRSVVEPLPSSTTGLRVLGNAEEVAKLLATEAWAIYAWLLARDLVRGRPA